LLVGAIILALLVGMLVAVAAFVVMLVTGWWVDLDLGGPGGGVVALMVVALWSVMIGAASVLPSIPAAALLLAWLRNR
jgi:hypothetical protein